MFTVGHMAKKRSRRYFSRIRRRRGRGDKRFPILTGIGTIAGLIKLFTRQSGRGQPLYEIQAGNWKNVADSISDNVQWAFTTGEGLTQVVGPILVGAIGSKVMTMVGANKAMKRMPFVGRYIKL